MAELSPAITVITKPHPFRSDTIVKTIPYGQRIHEIMDDLDLEPSALQARVLVDDQVVEKAYWHRVKPKAGHRLTIRVLPQGGGQGKDIMRLVAMVGVLALAVAAPYILAGMLPVMGSLFVGASGVTLLGAGLTLAVGIGGSVGLLALIPPAASRLIGDGR